MRLYRSDVIVDGRRIMDERLSLGEDNHIELIAIAEAPFPIRAEIIDELPVQLQRRDFALETTLTSGEPRTIGYLLHPVERGVYRFARSMCFCRPVCTWCSVGSGAKQIAKLPSIRR